MKNARIYPLEKPFPTSTEGMAIEKIDARVKKDVRSATFGVMQYMDATHQGIGRLRRKAESEQRRDMWEAKKLIVKGESGVYPGIPAMGQRDVRQMRSHKPGVQIAQEKFK